MPRPARTGCERWCRRVVRRGDADRRLPRRRSGCDDDQDDQGRRSTRSSTPAPATTSRPTRSTRRARRSRTSPTLPTRATARRSPGTPTSPPTRGSTTAPAPARSIRARADAANTTSHSVELTGLDAEHDLLLPGDVTSTGQQLHHGSPRSRPAAAELHHAVRDLHRHHRRRLRRRARRSRTPTSPRPTNGEVTLKPDRRRGVLGRPACRAASPADLGVPRAAERAAGATVSGGSLHVDGAYAGTDATSRAGRALEFKATFGAENFQHAGFRDNFNSVELGNVQRQPATPPTSCSHGSTTDRASSTSRSPAAAPARHEHRYRIEWGTSEVRFYVDGALVATHAATFGTAMHPIASDFSSGGPGIGVDWMRMSPYPASGSFDSRVFDAGDQLDWQAMSWDAQPRRRHRVALSVRTGNTPTPDGSWSVVHPGLRIGQPDRRQLALRPVPGCVQHQRFGDHAEPAGGDDRLRPGRTRPPRRSPIGARHRASTGVDRATNIRPRSASRWIRRRSTTPISGCAPRGRAAMCGDRDLFREHRDARPGCRPRPGAVYEVTVAGAAEDTSGNPLGATTPGRSRPPGDVRSSTRPRRLRIRRHRSRHLRFGDRERRGHPEAARGEPSSGAPRYRVDGSAPRGRAVGVRRCRVGASASTAPAPGRTPPSALGRALEFDATFTPSTVPDPGASPRLQRSAWATFSTKGDSAFYARTHNGSVSTETPLPSSLLGPRIATGSSGRRTRSGSSSTGTWSRPTA